MKELQSHEVVREILKKQDTCSIRDMNEFRSAYEKEHPDTYVCITRDDIYYVQHVFRDEFYWTGEVFIRQESLVCPVCGETYYKYPDNEKYDGVLNFINNENNKSELQNNSR
jgi:hypothetical protein